MTSATNASCSTPLTRSPNPNRRGFLSATAASLSTISVGYWTQSAPAQSTSVNEKLNIACIGTANRALADIDGVQRESIVALCDVDRNYMGIQAKRFPHARLYSDYREMIDAEKGKSDAVVVGTSDHHHAPATIHAIRQGMQVYCEKPLTHTVGEARFIAEEAAKAGVATQMGTQIHAGDNYRRVVELIQSGAIGDVTDVHVWVNKSWGADALPMGSDPVPEQLDWDLWLGPAEMRPYQKGVYHPAQWRRWWAFGQGTLGDMGCHYMDLPFWALDLTHPTTCEATGPPVDEEACPRGLTVRYQFAAVGNRVATRLTWYDGNQAPDTIEGIKVPGSGVMFVGTEGMLFASYNSYRLYPEEQFADFTPPAATIPSSIGHHAEWIQACKEGTPTTCNFTYSGRLTESVLLGNVAFRSGKALDWDGESLVATNCAEADAFVNKTYRPGWEVG